MDNFIRFSVPMASKKLLIEKANKEGKTLSALARELIFKRLNIGEVKEVKVKEIEPIEKIVEKPIQKVETPVKKKFIDMDVWIPKIIREDIMKMSENSFKISFVDPEYEDFIKENFAIKELSITELLCTAETPAAKIFVSKLFAK